MTRTVIAKQQTVGGKDRVVLTLFLDQIFIQKSRPNDGKVVELPTSDPNLTAYYWDSHKSTVMSYRYK